MSRRARLFIGRQWDTLLAFLVAAGLSGLAAVDVVGDEIVAASTLGVLALLGVVLVKHGETQERLGRSLVVMTRGIEALNGQLRPDEGVRELAGSDIDVALERGAATTAFWRFKGGTGTYLRAETLPRLSAEAIARREVWIEILDPTDVAVCQSYAKYRRSLPSARSADNRPWSLDRVCRESYATIVAALWFSEHRNLRVHVGVTCHMSILRYDMSSVSIVVTTEDSRFPATQVDAASDVYSCWGDELSHSYDQATHLNLSKVTLSSGPSLDGDHVQRVLAELDLLPNHAALTQEMCDDIAHQAISARHAKNLGFAAGGARNPYDRRPAEDGAAIDLAR